jgi:hypothetical protein
MKKPTKLMLNQQTLRTLASDELSRVVGGWQDCPDVTRLVSGCTVSPANSIIQIPAAKKV